MSFFLQKRRTFHGKDPMVYSLSEVEDILKEPSRTVSSNFAWSVVVAT